MSINISIILQHLSSSNADGGERKEKEKELKNVLVKVKVDNSIFKVDINGIVNNCTFIGAEGPALTLTGDQVHIIITFILYFFQHFLQYPCHPRFSAHDIQQHVLLQRLGSCWKHWNGEYDIMAMI